jgi:DUF1680 family protein
MKTVVTVAAALALAGAIAMAGWAQTAGGGGAVVQDASLPHVNVALFAQPSTSFVSGNESLEAVNDGFEPRSSRDHSHGAYGNWPRRGAQWVQYEWPKAVSTAETAVYWWADGQGVHLPAASRVLYWDGTAFQPVSGAKGLGVEGDKWNVTSFDEVTTTKLRLEFDGEGQNSTGILEWKVTDTGKSPAFAPQVAAGGERTVVMPGRTYLNGKTKGAVAGGAAPAAAWTKESGPGEVSFADATALSTAATFSAPGEYVLKLTARAGDMSSGDVVHVKVQPALSMPRLEPVYTKTYKISSGMWGSRMKPLITEWIPHCMAEISRLDLKEGGINNFIQAGHKLAGEPYTPHVGYPFSNAWVHNTVESMCVALMVDAQGDPEILKAQEAMRAKLEEWIPIILASQEPDGYMQTRFTLGTAREQQRRVPGHWTVKTEHEGYVAGYFLEAAIAHYLATDGKDRRLYDAAKRLADCWCNNIGEGKKSWYDGHEEMEQALVRFGRFVNDMEGSGNSGPGDKYVVLAKFLLDQRKGGEAYDQSHLPVVQQYEAVGHAVRDSYLMSGMADVATETHDADYQSAVASLCDNLVNKKWYITGGIGSGETSEGFGKDYSLRNNSYCESCSNCGALFMQWKMQLAYHDAKYADLYEETLYNAILGDFDLSGKNFTYTNALDTNQGRYGWHNCPCCVGNFPRTLLMLPTWMYSKGEDGLYVNLFVGSTVKLGKVAGTDVEMVQETDYPWSGKVKMTVNPAERREFALRVRAPDRSVSEIYSDAPEMNSILSLSVNGEVIRPIIERGYAVVRREWKAGDRVEMELPMKPFRVKAVEAVAADRGRVAIKMGPLVYNVESVDGNVDGVLGADSPLQAVWRPELLGGVMAVEGKYADGSPLLAIPNYVRENRGGRSVVWIRDR